MLVQKQLVIAYTTSNIANPGLQLLTNYLKVEAPDLIVVGYPKNMDGSIGERAEMVDYFIDGLKQYNPRYTDNEIIRVDERRTSKMAKQILIEAGSSRKQQKDKKDVLAAVLILEQYLNSLK
ncbi:hypothetical protein FQA39_LY12970 [Lamprigera yunnana]|nr:hypothetical protein FQA39_LY12970 [Lamprigera yunnana]